MEFFFTILLLVLVIAFICYLGTLKATLAAISEHNRKMSPGSVYLNLVPIFSFGWHFYTVSKIRESLVAELNSRNIKDTGNGAVSVGIAACVLLILCWIPGIGPFAWIAGIICWIVYWSRISNYKDKLTNPPVSDLLADGRKMTDEDHILAIYAKLSQERKDLSETGIILKIEEDYKYREDYIREVIEKHKKSS